MPFFAVDAAVVVVSDVCMKLLLLLDFLSSRSTGTEEEKWPFTRAFGSLVRLWRLRHFSQQAQAFREINATENAQFQQRESVEGKTSDESHLRLIKERKDGEG